MNPLVIACSILRDEVEHVIAKRGLQDALDVVWMPESLHNSPEKLKSALQEQIDAAGSARPEILLTYGDCGNALVGICAREVPLVMPRYADCIGMLLSARDDVDELRRHSIFMTRGWLDGEQGLEVQYRDLVERRGEKRARWIMDEMYKNYDELLLIDTGAYDVSEQLERARRAGELCHLETVVGKGDMSVLERLLVGDTAGPDFVCIAPHGQARLVDFFPELGSNGG